MLSKHERCPHEELSTIYYYTVTIYYYVFTIVNYKRVEKILCKTFGGYLSLFLKLAISPNEYR